MFGPHNSAYAFLDTTDIPTNRPTDRPTHIYIQYHAKSRLNTSVWGSLRSPNNCVKREKLVLYLVNSLSPRLCVYKLPRYCKGTNYQGWFNFVFFVELLLKFIGFRPRCYVVAMCIILVSALIFFKLMHLATS